MRHLRKRLVRAAAAVVGLAAAGMVTAAQAALVETDYLALSDGLITRDTISGREWLDVTQSLNLSYNDMVGPENNCTPFCTTGSFAGFTFATEFDVKQFMSNAGLNPFSLTGDVTSQLANDILSFVELVGPASTFGAPCEGRGSCRSTGLTSDLATILSR